MNNVTPSKIDITLSSPHYLLVGENITLTSTNSDPIVDGDYTVSDVIDATRLSVVITPVSLTTPGTTGTLNSVV